MKKTILILSALILATAYLSGQSCLPEGITITTQAQIDSFQINYPNCTEIEGDVIIGEWGSDIVNLSGLSVIIRVGGYLKIFQCDLLDSLTGFNNLVAIDGNLLIMGNDDIINFSGLSNLNNIGGSLKLSYNDNLTSLSGIEKINFIKEDLVISYNNGLKDLSGLENIDSIGVDLILTNNDHMLNLYGLNRLKFLGGDFRIQSVRHLASLTGVENLQAIGGDLVISNNLYLVNLTGLHNINSIAGDLSIASNPSLTELTGLDNIESNTIENLSIYDNPNLSTCEVESVCAYLASPNGELVIADNAIGCNSPEEVLDSCEANAVSVDELFADDLEIYPNPSSGALHLRIMNTEHRTLNIELYSIQGIRVRTLLNEVQQPGEYEMTFDISDLPAGMYFVRMQIGRQVETVKIIKVGDRR